jgi:hypothetical protein
MKELVLLEKRKIKLLDFKSRLLILKKEYTKIVKELKKIEDHLQKKGLIDISKFTIMKFNYFNALKELKEKGVVSKKTLFSISDISEFHKLNKKFLEYSNNFLKKTENKFGFSSKVEENKEGKKEIVMIERKNIKKHKSHLY